MSRMFRTPDQKRSRKRANIYNTCISSTPYGNAATKYYSISLSGIETGSSSSGAKIRNDLLSRVSEKSNECPKKKRKTDKKRRVVTSSRDADSEWETKSEESVRESSGDPQGYSPSKHDDDRVYNLFEDPSSPEKVRDVPIAHEPLQESPIFQSSRRLRLISKKNDDVVQSSKLLPVDLSSTKIQDICPEDTHKNVSQWTVHEDELIFRNKSNTKTYPAPLKRVKSPKRKPGNFMFPVRFPTATSDLLWDDFINKSRDDVSQYLAPTLPTRKRVKLTDSKRELPDIPRMPEINPIPAGMERVWGYWDKHLQKWISHRDECNSEQEDEIEADNRKIRLRKKNKRKQEERTALVASCTETRKPLYDRFDEIDIDFATGGRDGKQMSFREFRDKQRMKKSVLPSTSFHLDT